MAGKRRTWQNNLGQRGDEVYETLIAAHEGLTEAESHALNARLVLLMMNRIGDADDIASLVAAARSYVRQPAVKAPRPRSCAPGASAILPDPSESG